MKNHRFPLFQRVGKKDILAVIGLIVTIIIMFLSLKDYWDNRLNGLNPNGEYTNLRGGTIMQIVLPQAQHNEYETIYIQWNHDIIRTIIPSDRPIYSTVTKRIPDPLWVDLEMLRQVWCSHVPVTRQPAQQRVGYKIVLACHPTRNPILYFPENEIDPRLLTLIAVAQED